MFANMIANFNIDPMVARWCIFVRKITVWVYFIGLWNIKCWYIILGCLEYLGPLWYILWLFSNFVAIWNMYGHLVYCMAI
jgi:hypothetical protein